MEQNEDFMNAFQAALQHHIEQMYTITEEVSETGKLFERYRLKGHPLEIIRMDEKVFEFRLN